MQLIKCDNKTFLSCIFHQINTFSRLFWIFSGFHSGRDCMEEHIFITKLKKKKALVAPLSHSFSLWRVFDSILPWQKIKKKNMRTCSVTPGVQNNTLPLCEDHNGNGETKQTCGYGILANIRTWTAALAHKSFPRCSLNTPRTCRSAFLSTEWCI